MHFRLYFQAIDISIGSHGDDQESQVRISHFPLIHELNEDDVKSDLSV